MPLSADTLLDRLHLKSQITKWRLLAIAALVIAGVVIFEQGSPTSRSPIERSFVGRLTIEGVVYDDPERIELLQEIRDNPRIKALIVRLDTPGGSAVGGQEVFDQLREVAKQKPVVAVMRDLSASAGYMIALGTDRIYAREGTLTGSIGVILQAVEVSDLAQKIGVTPITIKTGPLKDALSPYHKATPEAIRTMQETIDDFFQVFVGMVAERRKLPKEEVLALADGRIFTGRQALKNKLIDALGGEEEAMEWLVKERKLPASLEVKDIEVKRKELPFLEKIAQSVTQKILPGSTASLDGLVAIWHPAVQLQ